MKTAIHLLNSLKHGGGENVAINYSKVLLEFNINSIFVGKSVSAEYEKLLTEKFTIKNNLSNSLIKFSDYIFVHSNINLVKLLFYIITIKIHKKRIIYIQHLNYSNSKFKYLSILINFICTDFIRITPTTEYLADKYIKIRKHFIVNFYINKYPENEYVKIRKEIRSEYKISDNKTIIMFSGVLKPGKGISDFIQLASKFQDNPNYLFLIVGDGPESNYVKEYCGSNTLWVGFQNDVEKFLIASDVYVFLSKIEMLPMALIEAINTNKPILAYSTLVNNYLLQDKTFEDIELIKKQIDNRAYPQFFDKFNFNYASKKIEEIF